MERKPRCNGHSKEKGEKEGSDLVLTQTSIRTPGILLLLFMFIVPHVTQTHLKYIFFYETFVDHCVQ